ncbi:MAG TPA: LPXTG cell wall anchor domain-containing protein [Clostridia bacterium]|nr:LPXTG cell wall anchor domain-containing protein [Clostridia bacterium]
MKKLFALVLTLALVFAIAAPAMAATWGAGTPNAGSPFTASVTTYKVTYDAFGNPVYTALGNSAVVEGTPVAFKVVFKVPSFANLQTYYKDMTGLTFDVGIDLTNLKNVAEIGTASGDITFNATNTGITAVAITAPASGDAAATYTYNFSAVVASTDKALVEAYIGYEAAAALPATYGDYEFSATGVENTVTSDAVAFTLNGSGVVTGWTINDSSATATYTVVSPTMFVQATGVGAGTILTSGVAFETVNDIYKEFVAVLGFNVASTGIYYTEANIVANYQPGGYAEATGTFAPYSSNLTVTDGTNVPNTGDNMSVIGFVMVGLALLATAAVIVKKVRA